MKKKPILRKPRAKPSVRHKSKKDYTRESYIKQFACIECGSEFFAFVTDLMKSTPFCINCIVFGEEDTP